MAKNKFNARLDKIISEAEFPLLHNLAVSGKKKDLYAELKLLLTQANLAEEEEIRCMRRSKRYNLKALCTLISGNEEERMLLTNISETGLKAMISDNTHVLVSHNKRIKIRLRILRDDSGTEVTVDARLVRIIEPNNGYLELCFDFENVSNYEQEKVTRFIQVYTKGEE